MATRKLPADPSVEHLRKQARRLLGQVQSGNPDALSRIAPYFCADKPPGLQSMQLVLAREYGFSSWSALIGHVHEATAAPPPVSATAVVEPDDLDLHDTFLAHAVLVYDAPYYPDPRRFDRARQLLERHPHLVDISLHAACAAGDAGRVARWLDQAPKSIEHGGGPHGWAPLLYATYARVPDASTLDVVRCLIARGAGPNAYYIANGQYRFTALTGVFGQGEAGPKRQPEHPDMHALARLLLDAGASPNDSQAAYNRMFDDDDTCLSLLLENGLSPRDRNNWWLEQAGRLVDHPDSTLHYQMAWAVRQGRLSRVQLLIEHGMDAQGTDDGRSMLEWALLGGHQAVADYLIRHGAIPVELLPVDRFRQAALSADRPTVERLLDTRPDLVGQVARTYPRLLHDAADSGRLDAVALLIESGFDVNHQHRTVPLHGAALNGHLAIVELLVEHGADTTRRDLDHFSPPIGHAIHADHQSVVDYLDTCELDLFSLVARGQVERLGTRLDQDPRQLEHRFADSRPGSDTPCSMDWMTPLAFAVANDRLDMVDYLLSRGACVAIDDDAGRSLLEVAREQAGSRVVERLEAHRRNTELPEG